jgi:hypothetical protein
MGPFWPCELETPQARLGCEKSPFLGRIYFGNETQAQDIIYGLTKVVGTFCLAAGVRATARIAGQGGNRFAVAGVLPQHSCNDKKGDDMLELSGIGGLLLLVLDIWALFSIFKSAASTGKKVLWSLLVIVLPLVGFIIWLIAGPRERANRI